MSCSDLFHCALAKRSVLKEMRCYSGSIVSFPFTSGFFTARNFKVLWKKNETNIFKVNLGVSFPQTTF